MRKTLKDEQKRKRVSISMNPEVYKLWEKYCIDNGIENYSEYIEKIIVKKINNL
jgi:metal-responsive CopG/Arc/MetJ family transcriptional regulator